MKDRIIVTPGDNEALFPGYTDVTINRITCAVTKHYSNQPVTYFSKDSKSITVNLYWPEGMNGYGSARLMSILMAYKRAFGTGFTGSIECTGGTKLENQGTFRIENNRIIR